MANVEAILHPLDLQRTTEELVRDARWSRNQLLRYRDEQLQRMLSNSIEHSAWYAESIGDLVKHRRPLSEFPVLTKQTLMNNFDEIILDKRITLAAVELHLSSDRSGERFLGEYCVFPTGGTSGLRAILIYDNQAWCNHVANTIRFLLHAGLRDDGRVIAIGSNSALHLSGRSYSELRKWRPGAPNLDLTMPMDYIVNTLNKYRPDVILTYTSFIRSLAVEQQSGNLKITPSLFGAVAESLSDDIRSIARKTWGVEILNRYNATEIGCASSECALPNGPHLPEDLVIFESVDDDNRPVPDGVLGRKVLITTLGNSVQPLVRYELTDLVAVSQEACSCGLPFSRLAAISGRREELLSLPGIDGKVKEIPAIYLEGPLELVPFLRQFQVVLRHQELEARIVISEPSAKEEAQRRAYDELLRELRDREIDISLRVSVVDEIPRQGTGSKIKLVVRE